MKHGPENRQETGNVGQECENVSHKTKNVEHETGQVQETRVGRQEIVNMGQDTAEERGQWTLTGLHTVCGIHSLILLLHCIILW